MTRGRIEVQDGFTVLLAALWCADTTNVLPLVLLAAAVHEGGHLLVLHLSGGRLHRLTLTACGAVLHCALPPGRCARAAVCLAGPAASFALTALAASCGWWRLAGASALLGLFNLLPLPPLDGGMALSHLCAGRFGLLRRLLAGGSAAGLALGGIRLWQMGGGIWLLLIGALICAKTVKNLAKDRAMV